MNTPATNIRLRRFGRRSLRVTVGIAVIAFPLLALAAPIDIPNGFSDGAPIVAEEFNENFDTIAAAINDNDARIADLEQQIEDLSAGGDGVPSGAVSFFTLAACPGGWTELTELRGRVAVGMPSGGTLGDTVGDGLTDLGLRTISQVPAHSHAVGTLAATSASAGAHSHTTGSDGAHSHTIDNGGAHSHPMDMGYPGDFGGYGTTNVAGSLNQNDLNVTTPFDGNSGAHTHTMSSAGAHTHSISQAAAHTHTITLSGNTGSNGVASVDVTMPYMQLLACQRN